MEFIAKGWSALKEVDRVIDYCELNDRRLIPLLRTAKDNFELALEADNSNIHARYWLSKLHLKYHVPGACKAIAEENHFQFRFSAYTDSFTAFHVYYLQSVSEQFWQFPATAAPAFRRW
ncbi:hypothetical protein GH714_035753 [Hevea brasiliensis]|uniref:Uncharacterized protein n=1 Tax=Hevea brasiliensis TaxID=3981 RepID=A0A6A6L8S3_HEVBR|nr:hypothetical protein GH714_035753 [Hevea brasiliensis]